MFYIKFGSEFIEVADGSEAYNTIMATPEKGRLQLFTEKDKEVKSFLSLQKEKVQRAALKAESVKAASVKFQKLGFTAEEISALFNANQP